MHLIAGSVFETKETKEKSGQCLLRFRISDQQPFDRPVAGESVAPARFFIRVWLFPSYPCPRNLIFCANSAKNLFRVPKLWIKIELLHLDQ